MMTTHRIDSSLPFALERGQSFCDDSEDDSSLNDMDDFLSMSIPSSSMNNSVLVDESTPEFLHLTAMVRAVYLSYLHKCLLSNYTTCYKQTDDVPSVEVKKYADLMELHAVRLALEVTLYRQNMLRMIADIKSHTDKKKVYKKLVIFLETPKDKIDVAVQTDSVWSDLHRVDNAQNICNTSNCEEILETVLNSSNSHVSENINENVDNEMDTQILQEITKEESSDASQEIKDESDYQIMDGANNRNEEEENSQDSLLQHMEDMFCESDDSTDLTKLIEKHSGVTKAHIDNEIKKICLEADSNFFGISQNDNIPNKPKVAKRRTSKGKVSFSRYKEMQNRKAIKETNGTEIGENKQKQRLNAIWFVERVHQISQLKEKMTELTLTNYRKHGEIKEQFLGLFGESEGEDMMPDSPICIEEYLPACKERIAPWIVKYLMPFYKKRRIKDRQLFKAVAKYITDMLIIENTFPEEKCVSKYIESYFKNKKVIKTKQDIYL
ncbi:uncharacterized protein LOC114943731 [Nylanderia fulva]|uniref:uncharacterized protein LOC114943731 n=1 Tax=Nylanderia fulva TaxID=613905 RepID=UPI0010FADF58|nr:uncharacterized protein LOC114943731 [Nylanderia fulva]XP_029175364.1 uncharacterized protein LOC114943731 [Nylanderia fulva]